ncbi:MAG: ExeA protein [Bordetella sp. SCN 67-23]|nr:AAA family ATPase [Burkholderiales bacterium]ODS75897.1 MAG: ExeA protein [Bordetella sp. SCN 67-23]OJW91773.1 MAG: ExeA protein [Burkholderiales bacterium 67-32]
MSMQHVLTDLEVSQADLARVAALSRAAVNRLVKTGEWPKRRTSEVRQRVSQYLRSRGAKPLQLRALFSQEKPPVEYESAGGVPAAQPSVEPLEESMLLRNQTLTRAAREHFKLPRSPFTDDIQSRADVFSSPTNRYVRTAMMDAALHHGFIAVVGESGSGKSTLLEELEQRIQDESRSVIIIRPYVLAMESNDQRGKVLKSGQIAESIMRTLAPNVQIKSSPDARFKQIHDLLKSSRQAGYTHLLAIEEAHCMPIATLKHLKRFTELKNGLQRLLGVALIGQPELHTLLSEQSSEVREVVQRCEVYDLPPLDNDLEAYIEHKFERVGCKPKEVFAPDAFDAIRARLVRIPRGGKASDAVSICYPLVVNNLICRAMNACAANAYPIVDGDVVGSC